MKNLQTASAIEALRDQSMNTLEIAFTRLLRSREYDLAEIALGKWAATDQLPDVETNCWRSVILFNKGETVAAIEMLSKLIDSGMDNLQRYRARRAACAYYSSDFVQALADYTDLLADKTPIVASMYHMMAQFRVAFVFALRGDVRFEAEVGRIKPGYAEVVNGKEMTADGLRRLYAAGGG